MRSTTYKCDRCGGESQDPNFLQAISVNIIWRGNQYESRVASADWCQGCVSEMKIAKIPYPKPKDYVPVVPSLEDLVREIVRQELGPDAEREAKYTESAA